MRPNNIEDIYPLSPMQQGILFHTLYAGEPETYVIQLVWTLRGPLDVSALQRAFQEVFDRHPALRTAFSWEKLAEPVQIVWKRLKIVFDEHDLRALPAAERAEQARRYIEADRKKGFDPTRAPLMRFGVLRVADEVHRFVWSMHHLLLDGWSTQIVVKEIFAVYEGIVRGALPRLPRARPYADFIGWLKKQDRAAIAAFWKQELAGFSAPTPLGIDRGADAGEAAFAASRRLLSEEATARLTTFARQHKLTPNTIVQGAWAILLSRYAREEDVVFGSTASGRSAAVPEIEGIVGLFINTLPVRARPRASSRVISFLTAFQAHEAELRDREHSPLAEVQAQSAVPRGTPLFESLVVFENFPLAELSSSAPTAAEKQPALAITDSAASERPPYPVTLTAILRRSLLLQIAHDAKRFDAAAIDRMLGHLVTLIEGVVADPEATIGRLPMLSAGELATLAAWNDTAVAQPADLLLHELVEAQAARTPDATALVYEGSELTYRELDERANRVANRLRALGVGPDTLVAVCLDRSLDLPIALYGVLKAGGAYVPIDPAYPKDRIDLMIDSARATVVLTDSRLASSLSLGASNVVAIDTDPEIAAASTARPERAATTPQHLAYVIFTSGSTGKPKGVMIQHRAIVNHMLWMDRAWSLREGHALLHKTPISFDASVWEIWLPLMGGARLVIARPGGQREAGYLVETMVRERITDLQLVPSMLEILLLEPDLERCTSLQRMFLGGEALSRSLVDRLRARRDVTVVNLYGPTECTVQSVVWTAEREARSAMEPIGRPIDNVRAYILDNTLARVPVGVVGELYIGGAAVGRGYLGRPDLTAERFLRDPFSDDPAARIYKTGDLCRYREDGVIEYVGRADFQIKIRGFRVELGEIEAVLGREPSVREAAVVLREDTTGDQRLVAYVVPSAETPSVADLAASLRRLLPDHMIPSAFVMLDAMPLSPSGKVERRALPAPSTAAAVATKGERVAPRTQVEQALVDIFAEVLKLAPTEVGATDSFFELGGHSLLATQAVTRARAAFGVDVPLRAIFEAPTAAALAARIEALLRGSRGAGAPPIVLVPRTSRMPLSFGQERLWFLNQLDPDSPAYVIPLALRLAGRLDIGALERTLAEIVRRHEVLRTTFESEGGKPVQIIHAPAPVPLPRKSLAGLSRDDAERAIRAEAEAEARKPFDLAKGPVIRARLLEVAEHDNVLLLTLHHIVSDVWTSAILNREITALYEAFSSGQPSPLAEPAVQYADYAAWQRAWLSGEVLEAHLAYWKKQLEGAPAALELPTDRPRPPVQSYRGGARTFTLSRELTAKLKDLARREGVTLYMTLLAAFDVLLHRWSGQDDIVVGTPIAGRQRAEIEGLVGFFLNTQVIRTRIVPEASFKELLAQTKEASLGAYAHQDMPFERLVQEIQPEPDPSRSPLFQVIFNLQNVAREGLRLRGLKLRGAVAENATVKVDLTLIMGEVEGGLAGRLEYSTDLFDASTIDRLAKQLEVVLAAVAKEPQRKLRDIAVLPDEERRRLVTEWNDTGVAFDANHCFHELFETQADATPDALAVVAGASRLSYRELDERANRVAHHLRGRGVGPDATVGICLPRTADMVVGILGVMKAGGAYVPLDPAYPPRRLQQLVTDAQIEVVVTHAALAPLLRDGSLEPTATRPRALSIVALDADSAAIEAESAARPELEATPANLAYVLFTSGSTGTPKGVAIEHRQLVNYVLGVGTRLSLPAGASYAHVSTFSADLGNTVLFPPLATGGCLHVIAEELTTDPDGLATYFEREGIDCMKIVPSHLYALLSSARAKHVIPRKLIVLGGEALRWEVVDRIEQLAPDCRILNHYGPTETTVGVLTYAIERGSRVPGTAIAPLGRPLPNSRVYVLDASMAPAPVGVPGEIYIGGDGVARGYLGKPELTKERFVPDPFTPGGRLYRTGDRARVLEGGAIAFLGRVDFQVKIRGFRVELGEIETALAASPGLRDAAVLVEEEPNGDKKLVAYVVPSEATPDLGGVRRLIAQRLPEHMVPSAFVVLSALPLTPNGKVDRKALAALDRRRDEAEFVGPQNPVEEILAAIWCDVFERERIGVHERFNDLGGHSLLAIQIVARARDAFQAEVPLRAIFEAPTIASLASRVAELTAQGRKLIAPPIEHAARNRPLPLSFAQERLWFLDRLEPGNAFYNVSSGMRLFGPLDAVALERALREVVRRHEVLRTTFALSGAEPAQIIRPDVDLRLPLLDLSAEPTAEREARLAAEVASEARAPFDLEHGPLFRARLIRLAPEEHALLLTLHHIVSDAQTQHVLGDEIAALYEAFKSGLPSPLRELPIQYADYAAWQRGWLSGEVLEEQLRYWQGALEGAPHALDLPSDRPRPPVMSYRGARRSFTFPVELHRRLVELSRQKGVTLFMTLLAAFDVLLYRRSGQADIVVGTPMTSRTRAETEGLIGFFLNMLAIRTRLDDAIPFGELVERVRDACLGAYAHQDLPFERLVHELSPKRDLSRTPIFTVMFTLQSEGGSEGGGALEGLRRRALAAATETAKLDLSLFLVEGARGMMGILEFATDLFDAATIDHMAAELVTLLEGAVAAPDTPICDLPLLPASERALVLDAWSATTAAYPSTSTIADLFEAQVARTPDNIAASFEGRELTYRALDDRANRLANRLRSLGVGPDVPVSISMTRSLDLVIGVLAILKAGGAYVPLDPEYPASRLAFMLEDARALVHLQHARFAEALPRHDATVITVDDPATGADLEKESASPPDRAGLDPSNLAYVIFTSGSTGRPKGVEMPHRALVNLVAWQVAKTDGSRKTIQLTSPSFDVFFQEVFSTWCAGGHLVLIPEEVRRDLSRLRIALSEHRVERMFLPPVALYQLAEVEGPSLPPTLREVIVAGEQIQITPRVAALLGEVPGVVLENHYGPSESHVVTAEVLTGPPASWPALPAIGRPIPNARILLLDARRRPVPVGVPGELYIGGIVLARGYLRRPDLTAQSFVEDPYLPGGRLYRTGDLARYLNDGTIEFLGRIDHQVKIRGYRVELGEVESVLARHSAIREVVVVAREYGPMDKRLVAYVVPDGASIQVEELKSFARARLPDYMVPPAFVVLSAMPLTPTGKVDRKALPAPVEPSTGGEDAYAAPRDEIEVRLAAIWREVLGKKRIGVTESFFDLGGHSILAVRMMREVEHTFGKKIPLVALFESQTIEHLADIVRRGSEHSEEWPSLVPMRTSGDKRPLFLVARPNVNSLGYIALIKRLDPGQPVYGLQLQYPEESALGRPYTLEERHGWAMRYIELMRAVQPEGPYFIAGMCEGALIAFDMVKSLEEQGDRVSFFGVFDTFPEENTSRFWLHRIFIYERTLKMLWKQGPEEFYRYMRSRAGRVVRTVISRVAPRVEVKGTLLANRIASKSPWDERMYPGPSWVPPRVDAHIDLFRVRKTYYWRIDDPEFGWGNRTRNGVDVHFIGGDHDTFMRSEHVPLLGKKLREALAAAEEQLAAEAAVAARAARATSPGGDAKAPTIA